MAKTFKPGVVSQFTLDQLQLDIENPRLADSLSPDSKEEDVVDEIVKVYGINDVLSSIAINGYFLNEPLLGVQTREGQAVTIVEGNRRLTACLILGGDARAKNQLHRREQFDGEPGFNISKLPVAIFRNRKGLLAYLGVRHIAGSKPWDGYAKATWIAKMLEEDPDLTIRKITEMTGDQHRTVSRLAEGFFFIDQLIEASRFEPSNSYRKGRGSSTEYPFSWVYTILGFKNIRNWLDMPDSGIEPRKNPLKSGKLKRGEQLCDFMFGNKSRERQAVVGDSRQLQDLAQGISDSTFFGLIKDGVGVKEALLESRSSGEKVDEGLARANRSLKSVWDVLGADGVSYEDSVRMEPLAKEVRKRASSIYRRVVEIMADDDDE